MSRNSQEKPTGQADNRTSESAPKATASEAGASSEEKRGADKREIYLAYDVPADAGYDAFGEPLREALESQLLGKKAHIKVTVSFV